MKRISITKPIWFIDNKNGNIYWFRKINEERIKGIEFLRHSHEIRKWGEWYFKDWKENIAYSQPERYRKLDFSDLSIKRKRNMFKGIFTAWLKKN